MKKFRWRLQRLLDLKIKQEEVLRGELITLMEKTAALRSRVMMLQAALRNGLMEIRGLTGSERMALQRQFLEHAPVRDRQIATLRGQLAELETQRKSKLDEMTRLRQFRKGLERLRQQALDEHNRRAEQEEQKLLDESANQAFYRNRLRPRQAACKVD